MLLQFTYKVSWPISLYNNGSQLGCTLACLLQYPGLLRANTFFKISLKRHFQNVAKPQTELLWARHWLPQITFLFCRAGCCELKKVGNHCCI